MGDGWLPSAALNNLVHTEKAVRFAARQKAGSVARDGAYAQIGVIYIGINMHEAEPGIVYGSQKRFVITIDYLVCHF